MKKGYMIQEGSFQDHCNWEIREPIVFPTKRELIKHMNKSGTKFYPRVWHGANKYFYCNAEEKWGFMIKEVSVLEKGEETENNMWTVGVYR